MSAAPRQDAGSGGLLAALGLFSVVPVPAHARHPMAGVLHWLPVVGLLLGSLACLPALAVWRGAGAGSPLLGAALVVTALALLTRGLHLDGTADLADGLGSGRPAGQALAIMRRPDVGAFGVAAVACVLILQVTALGSVLAVSSVPVGVLTVALATTTGRVAVLHAASRPPASGSSLGVLVAGSGAPVVRWGTTAGLLVAAAGARVVTGGSAGQVLWWVAAVVVALLVAALLARHAARRLGGVNGDVFGAVLEIATTGTLVVLAAGTAWT
ncbi:adenosylcobinamide-GDP ribazoletransferase [Blastococcus saxobsidens]|uniref:Adenosylcobinamide-GDP ribazoletransferase n=1 Tax=Blastococcus saxobsidens (strain DD2) TaxID=1146883 RepID=H6RNC1_BLASD|nr:adenosylcobinamide-GDP ribazoletransferase [Blastococcus saxobsidens]CCG02669.1 Cobalamin (vitamin B12) biosynthesis CobS, cobalamin-5-phosphate synthase [Blastococcus saxobsidens DD2]